MRGQELVDPGNRGGNGETEREEAAEPDDGGRGQKRERENADSD